MLENEKGYQPGVLNQVTMDLHSEDFQTVLVHLIIRSIEPRNSGIHF